MAVALYFATYAHYLNGDSKAYLEANKQDRPLAEFFKRQQRYCQRRFFFCCEHRRRNDDRELVPVREMPKEAQARVKFFQIKSLLDKNRLQKVTKNRVRARDILKGK